MDFLILDIEKHLIDMRDITSDKERPAIQRGFLMVDFVVLQRIIKEIESHSSVQDAAIVSRSGMHVAGEVPRGAHMETYVAMSAILLGAAESARIGLGGCARTSAAARMARERATVCIPVCS